MHPRCCRPVAGRQHRGCIITQAVTQSSVPEDGQNNCPKHVELTGIINMPLLLHLVGCRYYLYQRCTVKQISDNEIYLLIKCIESVLWRAAKCLSYIENARCLKVTEESTFSLRSMRSSVFFNFNWSDERNWRRHMCYTRVNGIMQFVLINS